MAKPAKRIEFVGGPADGHVERYDYPPRVGCPFEIGHRESVVSHLYVFTGKVFQYRWAVVICSGR